jgi:hypothetical protein
MRKRGLTLLVAGGVAVLLAPADAAAHFILTAPPAYSVQGTLGDPQKSAPCGQADPGTPLVANNVVTSFHAGETITVTLTEAIMHPGHYRVALANSQAELPADPPVTAGGGMACGTTVVQSPAVLPVLADGMLEHTATFNGPQSFQVTLPAGFTCTKCTLQVIEFMSNHPLNNPGGCFYHHCADVSIQAAGGTPDASTGVDAGTTPKPASGGCAIASRGAPGGAIAIAFALSILVLARRRRP